MMGEARLIGAAPGFVSTSGADSRNHSVGLEGPDETALPVSPSCMIAFFVQALESGRDMGGCFDPAELKNGNASFRWTCSSASALDHAWVHAKGGKHREKHRERDLPYQTLNGVAPGLNSE